MAKGIGRLTSRTWGMPRLFLLATVATLVALAANALVSEIRAGNIWSLVYGSAAATLMVLAALYGARRRMMRLAPDLNHLIKLQCTGIYHQVAAGIVAYGPGATFPGRQVDPLPIRRYTQAMRFEHILPAPCKHIIGLAGDDLPRIGVDYCHTGQRYAAHPTAITRTFRGNEYDRMCG